LLRSAALPEEGAGMKAAKLGVENVIIVATVQKYMGVLRRELTATLEWEQLVCSSNRHKHA
jgi:hypothetical protein